MLKPNPDPLQRSFSEVYTRWLADFDGKPLKVNFRELVGANSGVDRFTHLIHPYPAKLLFNIPLLLLNCEQLGGQGDTIYDPFCGSGTVLLEGLLAGRRVFGADSNPVARILSSAKTTALSALRLEEAFENVLEAVPRRGEGLPAGPLDLEQWFSPSVLRGLDRLATSLRGLPASSERSFLLACFSATVQRTSLADPTVSVPVRINPYKQTLTREQKAQRRVWLKNRLTANVLDEFTDIVTTNIARMSRLHDHLGGVSPVHIAKDAREPATETLDLILTSPPYASAQKYIRSSSLSIQWLGFAEEGLRQFERRSIGREHFGKREIAPLDEELPSSARGIVKHIRRKNELRGHIAQTFLLEMREALTAAVKKLRPSGHLVLVVGNNLACGRVFDTQKYLTEICTELGLTLKLSLVDRIHSRGLITKRNETASVIKQEWINIYQKS